MIISIWWNETNVCASFRIILLTSSLSMVVYPCDSYLRLAKPRPDASTRSIDLVALENFLRGLNSKLSSRNSHGICEYCMGPKTQTHLTSDYRSIRLDPATSPPAFPSLVLVLPSPVSPAHRVPSLLKSGNTGCRSRMGRVDNVPGV